MANPWTAEQARKEVDAWRSSGQSIDRSAKERRVGAHRLRYWKKRFGDDAAAVSNVPMTSGVRDATWQRGARAGEAGFAQEQTGLQ
jgi:hypothetical protein